MAEVVIVFDFDKTVIACDSDDWVIDSMGLTQLFNSLLPTMPYNSLMDKMMEELHLRGITKRDIAESLRKVPLSPNIISAINLAYASGCDLRILSDANTFFIETILSKHGVLHCFCEINTNPVVELEDGRLQIIPYHDFKSSSHGCCLCPPNLCKGLVFSRIRDSCLGKGFIYIGDGNNDVCPSLRLSATDYVMPRKHLQLWDAICSNPALIQAAVHEWDEGDELEQKLLKLISSLITKENHSCIPEEFILTDCKTETNQVSAPETFRKTVQIPH